MINFLLVVNKRGQPRLRKCYDNLAHDIQCEPELIKQCIMRDDRLCNFFNFSSEKIVYRKYGSLYFIAGITEEENELATWEFLHNIVETFNEYFTKVTEIDIMLNTDRVHFIIDEMICNGRIVESSRLRILSPLHVMDEAIKK